MNKKTVLVHDFLVTLGGAERVLKELSEMFPEAPIYTLLYDEEAVGSVFPQERVRTSVLQRLPRFVRRRYRWLLPFCASAVESFDLRDFDVVISSSGAWSKGVVTKLKTKHLAYIHSPMRYVWDYNERYLRLGGKRPSICKRLVLSYLRLWDVQASDRPDMLVANSKYTQRRIEKYYRRESGLVYPPVVLGEGAHRKDVYDKNMAQAGYFLLVSRLTESKNISLVLDAFHKLSLPLWIIGDGYDAKTMRRGASKTTRFLGRKSDQEVQKYMANARALLFPSDDDFGIVPVEAMQLGTPVIALRKGGAQETVEEGKTGIFFDAPVSVSLADAIRRFLEYGEWNREYIRERGMFFSRSRFREGIMRELNEL